MLPDWILKHLRKAIALLWGLVIATPIALSWGWLPQQLSDTKIARTFLILSALVLLIALYALASWWLVYSKDPRRFLRFVEKGAFWESRRTGVKYCGVCSAKNNERCELKYDKPNQWSCLKCLTPFTPHEPRD